MINFEDNFEKFHRTTICFRRDPKSQPHVLVVDPGQRQWRLTGLWYTKIDKRRARLLLCGLRKGMLQVPVTLDGVGWGKVNKSHCHSSLSSQPSSGPMISTLETLTITLSVLFLKSCTILKVQNGTGTEQSQQISNAKMVAELSQQVYQVLFPSTAVFIRLAFYNQEIEFERTYAQNLRPHCQEQLVSSKTSLTITLKQSL